MARFMDISDKTVTAFKHDKNAKKIMSTNIFKINHLFCLEKIIFSMNVQRITKLLFPSVQYSYNEHSSLSNFYPQGII